MAKIKFPAYKRQRPNTTISVDDSALGATAGDSVKNIVLVGKAEGGEPHVLYELTSFPQARDIFKGGELLDAIELAWTPSDTEQGAGVIYAMRADEATQAKLDKDPVIFISEQYGAMANKIVVELSDNSLTNSKRLRVRDTGTNEVELFDNLGNIFVIKYTGSEALATATIANKKLIIKTGAEALAMTEALTYDLTSVAFQEVANLITDISGHEDFEAYFVPYGEKNIYSVDLDEVEDADIKLEGHTFTALIADMVKQTQYSQFIRVEKKEDGTGSTVANFSQTPLAGGSNGEAPASWATLFRKIGSDDAPLSYYLVPITPNAQIHGEASAFVNEQSNAGYAMRTVVGGSMGETYSQTVARQSVLYNPRVSLVGFDAEVRTADGRIVAYPAYMLSAMIAGLASGLEVGEPITYKHLRVARLLRNYTSDQLDQLHLNGVIGCEKVRNLNTTTTFRVVSDVTTFNTSTSPVKAEMGLGEETDFLVMELRESLDQTFIGTRISSVGADAIKSHIQSFLILKKMDNQIQDFDPADISVVIIGDRAELSFVANPARGLNHINGNMIYRTQELQS